MLRFHTPPVWRLACLFALMLTFFLASQTPVAAMDDRVFVSYEERQKYSTNADNFDNVEVTGWQSWESGLQNQNYGSDQTVTNTVLTLATLDSFEYARQENLIATPPPEYRWEFGNVEVDEGALGYVENPETPSVNFTPGFDLSRSADQTEFSALGTQVLTITVTPRESLANNEMLFLSIGGFNDAQARPNFDSITGTDDFHMGSDGNWLNITVGEPDGAPPTVDKTYIYKVWIEINPVGPGTMFLPMVAVERYAWLEDGGDTGSSLSHAGPEGTWTWNVGEIHNWVWSKVIRKGVSLYGIFSGGGPEPQNAVVVDATTNWEYEPEGDSFTNGSVIGTRNWGTHLHNQLHETGESLTNVALDLDNNTGFEFDWVQDEHLADSGPLDYRWEFGLVPVDGHANGGVGFGSPETPPVEFTPGFDASRSVNPTEFSGDGPHIQTLTISVTPREELPWIGIGINAEPREGVDAIITSPTTDENIQLSPDGRNLNIHLENPEIGTTYTFTVTLAVTLTQSEAQYLPSVMVMRGEGLGSGSDTGTSLTVNALGAGTWTWSTTNSTDTEWQWYESHNLSVVWRPQGGGGPGPQNAVVVDTTTNWDYEPEGDFFVNGPVTGTRGWNTHLQNQLHETGESLADVALTLDSGLGFDWVQEDNLTQMPPPVYRWEFGEIPLDTQAHAGVWFGSPEPLPAEFTPRFDASRTVNVTEFSVTGTQTIVIKVTPREPMDRFIVQVEASPGEGADAVITSPTDGPGIHLSEDERHLTIDRQEAGFGPPVIGDTYTYEVTLLVTPTAPPAVYLPRVAVVRGEELGSGSHTGTSLTADALDAGTWTWSTTNNTDWQWHESHNLSVVWHPPGGGGPEPEEAIQLNFDNSWEYQATDDTFIDSLIEGRQGWNVQLDNRLFESEQIVVGATVTLDSDLSFDHVQQDGLITQGPLQYLWEFGDIPPGGQAGAGVGFDSPEPRPVPFMPGFDASRSVDITEFEGPDTQTQTLTITVTPRVSTPWVSINVQARGNEQVEAVITSPTSGDNVWLSEDGRNLNIHLDNPEIDVTFTQIVTLNVTPLGGTATYMPFVGVARGEDGAGGVETGTSLSRPVPDVGTWTWSADESYEWQWNETRSLNVTWQGTGGGGGPEEPENAVQVTFDTNQWYETAADEFTNGLVIGQQSWGTHIENRLGASGDPVIDATLTLASGLEFEWVSEENLALRGPELYRWEFDDLDVGDYRNVGVGVGADSPLAATFTPGFDVTRSADISVFNEQATQTLLVTVTPREPMGFFSAQIETGDAGHVEAVITGATGSEEIYLSPDGRSVHINVSEPIINTVYEFEITIDVIPNGVPTEFVPAVSVHSGPSVPLIPVSGTSVSHVVPDIGTWTWSAASSTDWLWLEATFQIVTLLPIEPRNVYGEWLTWHAYESVGDSFDNAEVIGQTWWHTTFQNSGDGSGLPVEDLNLSLDSTLDLESLDIWRPPVLIGPPTYRWAFGDAFGGSDDGAIVKPADPGVAQVTFTPGFDVLRSVDRVEFTEPGIQTLTVDATSRSDSGMLLLMVLAPEDGAVDPVILSVAGAIDTQIESDGHQLFAVVLAATDTTTTFEVEIQVTPKVARVEFTPEVWLFTIPDDPINAQEPVFVSGTSHSLAVPGLGTWTWQAVSTYAGYWFQELFNVVTLEGGAVDTTDSDNDGIDFPVDGQWVDDAFIDESKAFSSSSTDEHLGGTTFVSIEDRADLFVTVQDGPNPDGLLLGAAGGIGTAEVIPCGLPINLNLNDGDSVLVTCGSLITEVLVGPVEVLLGEDTVLVVSSDTTVTVTEDEAGQFEVLLGEGIVLTPSANTTVVVTEDEEGQFEIVVPEDSQGTVTVESDGAVVELDPGDSVLPSQLALIQSLYASKFGPPMGKVKKTGSTLPVKFSLFLGETEITSQEQLNEILTAAGYGAACPAIGVFEVESGTGIPDTGNGSGCFRFSDEHWIYNLLLDPGMFEPNTAYRVEIEFGDIVLTPEKDQFATR